MEPCKRKYELQTLENESGTLLYCRSTGLFSLSLRFLMTSDKEETRRGILRYMQSLLTIYFGTRNICFAITPMIVYPIYNDETMFYFGGAIFYFKETH